MAENMTFSASFNSHNLSNNNTSFNSRNLSHNSSINTLNLSQTTSTIRNGKKTPLSARPTPAPTPARIRQTRKAKVPKAPLAYSIGADRFIPDRNAFNCHLSHYLLNNDTTFDADKKTTISETMGDLSKHRIINCINNISYQQHKLPPIPGGYANNCKVIYSLYEAFTTKKTSRYIPNQPERILDAPDIIDDFYLQHLDWSSANILAVALKNEVFLWNGATGHSDSLLSLDEPDYISSLSWAPKGSDILAVGISDGPIQLWDASISAQLRTLNNDGLRINSMSWNEHTLSNGSRDGNIYNHDVRIGSSLQSTYTGHRQDICGLKWSPSGRLLASGSNDNTVKLWSPSGGGHTSPARSSNPVTNFTDHRAAVKALAWCPWRSNTLATGGGTADRTIRLWNCQTGQSLQTVDTHSQVSAILWSGEYKELISSHGYVNNELIIWKYPTLGKVTQLIGHSARILGMAMSPDGHTVVSLGADETLRFWECFQVDPETKRTREKSQEVKLNKESTILRLANIR